MLLLQKKCKTIFCKTLIVNAGINYTKKDLEIKFITKIFVKSILWLESLNIIIIKKKKKQLKKQIEEPNRYEECNCKKILFSHKPCMSLKESVS